MFQILISTKFSTISFNFKPNKKEKYLGQIAASIIDTILTNKNLYTDGTRRPYFSKSKISIVEGQRNFITFEVIPSKNVSKFFSQIAWGLRNKFPKQFSKIFKIPNNNIEFNKEDHYKYVRKWLESKSQQHSFEKPNPYPTDLKKHVPEWTHIISTPMYS